MVALDTGFYIGGGLVVDGVDDVIQRHGGSEIDCCNSTCAIRNTELSMLDSVAPPQVRQTGGAVDERLGVFDGKRTGANRGGIGSVESGGDNLVGRGQCPDCNLKLPE